MVYGWWGGLAKCDSMRTKHGRYLSLSVGMRESRAQCHPMGWCRVIQHNKWGEGL